MVLLVFVDGILEISSNMACINMVKQTLHDLFKIRDLGEARFLGMEFTGNGERIQVTQ